MMHAPKGASIIEMPLMPHSVLCFGYLAMALGLDYWILPSIAAPYHQRYYFNASSHLDHVLPLIWHLVEQKGLAARVHQSKYGQARVEL